MKVIILGAGLSGLAAALKLVERGFEVSILEKESFLGGLASSYSVDWNGRKYWISKTYHHILQGDKATLDLIEKVKLDKKLRRKRVKTGFIYKHEVHGFSTPLEILRFPLPFMDKLRLANFIFKVSRKRDWSDVEKMNAKEWIIEGAGRKNFEVFFDQLIRNKFSESPSKISAAWFGTRFAKEPTSFLKSFGWMEGGIQQIIDGVAKRIERKGGKIEKTVEIKKVKNKGNKKVVVYRLGGKIKKESGDAIISTIPPSSFLRIYKLPPQLAKQFREIEYLSCICACIGLKSNLTEYYWLNILDKGFPFAAIFNHTALYEDSAPEGKSVMFLVSYLRKGNKLWRKRDEQILKIYIKGIEKVFPGFSEKVEWYRIARFKHAEAIFDLNFKNPPISFNGIYFAGIYRIFPKIRNMASAIESGWEAASALLKDLSQS